MTSTSDRDLLCYIHIAKNSGNTIRDVLERNYPGRLGEFMVHKRTSALSRSPKTVDALDEDVRTVVSEAVRLAPSVDCLALNLPYGVHRMLRRPVRYFTFLREPVERCLSYWYWAYAVRHRGTGTIWHLLESFEFDLARILDSGRLPAFSNDQTRFVTGSADLVVTREHLAQAKKAIRESFFFVGAVERFPDCHAHLATRLDWKDQAYGHLNHANRDDGIPLPDRAAELFHDRNEIDAELHDWLMNDYLPGTLNGR